MTLIEALLTLPPRGDPMVANGELAAALSAGSRFVQRLARQCWLTHDGRRFLMQFLPDRAAAVTEVAVRLVLEDRGPVFHLVCDAGTVLRVHRNDLRSSLREIQCDNPDVRIVFDFRRSGGVS